MNAGLVFKSLLWIRACIRGSGDAQKSICRCVLQVPFGGDLSCIDDLLIACLA